MNKQTVRDQVLQIIKSDARITKLYQDSSFFNNSIEGLIQQNFQLESTIGIIAALCDSIQSLTKDKIDMIQRCVPSPVMMYNVSPDDNTKILLTTIKQYQSEVEILRSKLGMLSKEKSHVTCLTCASGEQVEHMECLGGYKYCPKCGRKL